MRISRYRRHFHAKPEEPRYRANEGITAPEVRVVDENGGNLGVLPTSQALATARERGYDLVEISPKAVPPVVKFINYTQFKYEKQKEARLQKAHAKKVEVKGVRLSIRIGQHDLDIRREKALEFLNSGHKVQLEIVLRGREKQLTNMAEQVMRNFFQNLKSELTVKIEQPFSRQGGRLTMLIARE
ncbi:translation initiation factor IF-3 [Patescibacteria group bacterium]|nr:MAG: translation initiation factor IF-3 [Patescibacteria group bacterium]